MNEKEMIRIAIADDHTLLRTGLAQLINSFGQFVIVIESGDGADLIRKIHECPVRPHVCIIDVNMPVLDGFGALTEIKKTWPDMKVLALSMYNNEFTIIRMLRNGANGYLLKNCNPVEFQDALLSIYEHGYYESGLTEQHNKGKEPHSTPAISPKELEFLTLCCSELVYKEIADRMNVSRRTVEDYRDNLFKKLRLNTRSGLVMYAMRAGIIHD